MGPGEEAQAVAGGAVGGAAMLQLQTARMAADGSKTASSCAVPAVLRMQHLRESLPHVYIIPLISRVGITQSKLFCYGVVYCV